MFEVSSRYYEIETESIKIDTREIVYKKRRFIPNSKEDIVIQAIMVAAGDRLDQIATRTLGDPEQFWRICDVNYEMHPLDLTSEPGKVLSIPSPRIY